MILIEIDWRFRAPEAQGVFCVNGLFFEYRDALIGKDHFPVPGKNNRVAFLAKLKGVVDIESKLHDEGNSQDEI